MGFLPTGVSAGDASRLPSTQGPPAVARHWTRHALLVGRTQNTVKPGQSTRPAPRPCSSVCLCSQQTIFKDRNTSQAPCEVLHKSWFLTNYRSLSSLSQNKRNRYPPRQTLPGRHSLSLLPRGQAKLLTVQHEARFRCHMKLPALSEFFIMNC